MKKKLVIINLSLTMAVLFSILFQSFHSYEHLAKQLTEKHCHHHYNVGKTEFTHHHADFDHCFVCEFTLGNYISPDSVSFKSQTDQQHIAYFFYTSETPDSFSGSCYSLRGPPFFIV